MNIRYINMYIIYDDMCIEHRNCIQYMSGADKIGFLYLFTLML